MAEDGRRLDFDLYVDCSGFRSLLLGGALGSAFVGYEGSLFTDRAVVGAAPHGGRLPPRTEARTLAAGWSWSIPQEEADHVGYVFSSRSSTRSGRPPSCAGSGRVWPRPTCARSVSPPGDASTSGAATWSRWATPTASSSRWSRPRCTC